MGVGIGNDSYFSINIDPKLMLACKSSYLGITKLYNKTMVKDPKNPPGLRLTQKLKRHQLMEL
jgi:hypothetical protein